MAGYTLVLAPAAIFLLATALVLDAPRRLKSLVARLAPYRLGWMRD